MSRAISDTSTSRYDLASLVRGLYGRVARELKLDPSYVSRVARGERRSETVEAALEREMKRIIRLMGSNRTKANHVGKKKKSPARAKR